MKEKLLLMAASLLGFATACNNKEERILDMYGCPYINYKVKGKVTDKAGQPIKGIEVSTRQDKPAITTNSDGSYELAGEGGPNRIEITFTDTDGPANGGDFAEKTVSVEFTEADRTEQGKDWYESAFAKSGVDAELEEKE